MPLIRTACGHFSTAANQVQANQIVIYARLQKSWMPQTVEGDTRVEVKYFAVQDSRGTRSLHRKSGRIATTMEPDTHLC